MSGPKEVKGSKSTSSKEHARAFIFISKLSVLQSRPRKNKKRKAKMKSSTSPFAGYTVIRIPDKKGGGKRQHTI